MKRDTAEKLWTLRPGNVGYIKLTFSLTKDSIHNFFKAINDTKAIIVDLRQYPNPNTFHEFLSYTFKDSIPFAKFLKFDITNPGYFKFNSDGFIFLKSKKDLYQGKIIVLVSEYTQSLGEFWTMALQVLPKTTVIGSTTWGADGDRSSFYLPGKLECGFSGLGIFYPDGSVCQRKGIRIDIEARPTIEGLRAGKDELLDRAIRFANEQ